MNSVCSQKMPHMQMRDLKENHVLSREPLKSSMNQKNSPQMIIKSGDRFEDGKKSLGRRNGRRIGRGHKVDRLLDGKKLEPSIGSTPCKSLMFHRRPGYGLLGTKCMVKANHFLAEIPGSDLSHYSVSFLYFCNN